MTYDMAAICSTESYKTDIRQHNFKRVAFSFKIFTLLVKLNRSNNNEMSIS